MWGIRDLGIAGATLTILTIGIVPILIIVGVLLAVGVVGAFLTGWLNTIIYLFAGIGISWLVNGGLKFFGVSSPVRFLLIILIVLVMSLIGWGINHTSYFSMMPNPTSLIASQPEIVLSQNSVTGEIFGFTLDFQTFGAFMSTLGAALGVVSVWLVTRKPKKHHR